MEFLAHVWAALVMAAAMVWQVGWSLVLGFTLSGLVQALVSRERMQEQLGGDGTGAIARATAYGIVSSSCSYAAAALSKTLFKKGAGLTPSFAFLFSSTNLVIELGIILYVLMGWQFMLAEWVGGLVLVTVMSVLVKATYPKALVIQARAHEETAHGHDHGEETVAGATVWDKLRNPQTRVLVAQNVAMDWSMLQNDLVIGFLIAGVIAVFVPAHAWAVLFAQASLAPFVGAVLAIITFVCSIGNVPMAAIFWGTGMSFGGVLAFLYADIIVLPLVDVYRKYYGWRMAAYLFGIFFVTIVISAFLMDAAFAALHLIPAVRPNIQNVVESFSFNYTFVLNVIALAFVGYLVYLNRKHPMHHEHDCH
jgi:uncharacterized membrane protein YraQ (UPF0718 family)